MRPGWTALVALAVPLAGGCAKYVALPLTSEAVERSLRRPDRETLLARAAGLHNPLLRGADFDPSRPLTPDGAAVLAVLTNPTLRAARDRIAVGDARLMQARILPNPALTYNLDVPVGSNTGGEVTGYGLGIDWEITSLIARGARVRAAEAATQQFRLDIAWQEWQVAQAARQAAYDVVASRNRLADAIGLAEQLEKVADNTAAALRLGDLKVDDASAARAAVEDARVSLATARRELRDAQLALGRSIGLPPSDADDISPDVVLPRDFPPVDRDRLTKGVEERRIDLVALRRGYDSQDATLRAAILGQFPKISLGVANTRDTGDFLTLGPALSADLPFFDHNQGNIAIERATRQQLFDEYVARVFEARADVASSVADIESLTALIDAQERQVTSLRALVAANQRALAQGSVDSLTAYVATVSLTQKLADLTTLKQNRVHAWIALELAAGARLFGPQTSLATPARGQTP